ncbi:MAG TPA: MATE family efflux transporter [candidate division Zixibacteria bacterium]|nr:MATE family efflux transporter [candidate division Zixibacteria bacterium]
MSQNNENRASGRDLTRGHIVGNLIRLSLPIMIGNFLHTLHNIVDAFWLGKLGERAAGAVSVTGIAFPVVFTLLSFGAGFGVAGTALVARFEGAALPDRVRRAVGQLLLVSVFFLTIFLFVGLFFADDILRLIQVPTEIFELSVVYVRIVVVGMAISLIAMLYQAIAHGSGDTVSPMIIVAISVIINIILDPLMIFGVGFFPRMEVAGAAWATLLSQSIGAIIAVGFFLKRDKTRIPSLQDIVPDMLMLKNIFRIAIPASIGQSATSFGFLFLQGFVNTFGTIVISTFAIGNRMTGVFMMPAMGISNALSAVIGQNLGAGNIRRAEESFHKAFILIMIIMGVGSALVFLSGAELTKFFIDMPEIVEVGVRMFRVTSIASFIFGAMFVFTGVFNGAGLSGASLRVNIGRLWLFRIPLVYLLSGKLLELPFIARSPAEPLLALIAQPLSAYPYDALWWSMVFSNSLATLWCYIIYRKGKWKRLKFE